MIETTIGVIPPRNELNSLPDKKTAENSKDLKSEFEHHLKQLDKKDPDRAFGGTKKKMHEEVAEHSGQAKKKDDENENKGVEKKRKKKLVNEEMVLNGMASNESANKTPDSEDNLDGLEETNLIQNVKPQAEQPVEQSMAAEALPEMMDEAVEQPKAETLAVVPAENVALEAPAVETAPVADQAVEMSAAVLTELTSEMPAEVDPKVFEALNREQLFQKLENMKQIEVPVANADRAMDGAVSTAAVASLPFQQSDQNSAFSQDESFGKEDSSDPSGSVTSLHAGQAHHAAKDFAAVSVEAQKSESLPKDAEEANLKEILNQAKYLVTKGGGEVSVKMTPEGMGEVQLKVMLENGKMSLEMNTHDKNIQRMIQDSLSDLKSSLAVHQINVEHVTLNNKINTVQDAPQASYAQNFSDAHAHTQQQGQQQDQRQQAGQVLMNETMKAMPMANQEIKKASAHRIYQNNKANSLNAVA